MKLKQIQIRHREILGATSWKNCSTSFQNELFLNHFLKFKIFPYSIAIYWWKYANNRKLHSRPKDVKVKPNIVMLLNINKTTYNLESIKIEQMIEMQNNVDIGLK